MPKIRLIKTTDEFTDFVIMNGGEPKYQICEAEIEISKKRLAKLKRTFEEFAKAQAELQDLINKGRATNNAQRVQVSVVGGGAGEEQ